MFVSDKEEALLELLVRDVGADLVLRRSAELIHQSLSYLHVGYEVVAFVGHIEQLRLYRGGRHRFI